MSDSINISKNSELITNDEKQEDEKQEDEKQEDEKQEDEKQEDEKQEDEIPEDLQTIDLQSEDETPEDLQTIDLQSEDLQTIDLQSEDLQTIDLQSEDEKQEDLQTINNPINILIESNFDEIKNEIVKKIESLDNNPLVLDIITTLIEIVEVKNGKWKLKGQQKEDALIIICKLLSKEFKNHPINELSLLSSILNDEKQVKRYISMIFEINNGIFTLQTIWYPEDGLEDEIEMVMSCYSCCIPALSSYFNKCLSKKNKKVKS